MKKPMPIFALMSRTAVYTLIWWGLTNGAADSWPVGVPVILAAVYIDFRLFRPGTAHWSAAGSIAFALVFLKASLSSGLDVIRRTYHPRLPLKPAIIEYPLKLTSSAARNLFVCTVSLLPGTLSTAVAGQILIVHVLDVDRPVAQELDMIEHRVAAIFKNQEVIDHTDRRNK
jgi:multicomponent Na+:H+ antiporter subunit E